MTGAFPGSTVGLVGSDLLLRDSNRRVLPPQRLRALAGRRDRRRARRRGGAGRRLASSAVSQAPGTCASSSWCVAVGGAGKAGSRLDAGPLPSPADPSGSPDQRQRQVPFLLQIPEQHSLSRVQAAFFGLHATQTSPPSSQVSFTAHGWLPAWHTTHRYSAEKAQPTPGGARALRVRQTCGVTR